MILIVGMRLRPAFGARHGKFAAAARAGAELAQVRE